MFAAASGPHSRGTHPSGRPLCLPAPLLPGPTDRPSTSIPTTYRSTGNSQTSFYPSSVPSSSRCLHGKFYDPRPRSRARNRAAQACTTGKLQVCRRRGPIHRNAKGARCGASDGRTVVTSQSRPALAPRPPTRAAMSGLRVHGPGVRSMTGFRPTNSRSPQTVKTCSDAHPLPPASRKLSKRVDPSPCSVLLAPARAASSTSSSQSCASTLPGPSWPDLTSGRFRVLRTRRVLHWIK